MKKLIPFMMVILLTGCWDVQELTEIGIVAAMAIDMDEETGEYQLTAQYLRPSAESTFVASQDDPFLMITVTGRSISEMLRKTNHKIDRKGFYAHNKVVIVSEEVAKEGLLSIFETFQREQVVRSYVWLGVTRDTSAASVLEKQKNSISKVSANFLSSLFDNAEYEAVAFNLLKFYKQALRQGMSPVLGVLSFDQSNQNTEADVQLSGGAAFNKDKLIGFMNNKETMAYNWITNHGGSSAQGGLTFPYKEDKYATLKLIDINSSIKPKVTNEKDISYTIEIKKQVEITEQQELKKTETRKELPKLVAELEKQAEKEIENRVAEVIKKAQEEFQADIFGFGSSLRNKYPKVWKKVKDNWGQEFANVPYEIKVEVEILNAGLLQGSLHPQE
ncbi:spore germination protein KC [Gracilibacillus orientalis]|uniref:Spore germination protein KC n=1 Tax=Gracilibacillus orientalis TaxID=334253 RepID=A0A1I4Q0B8_9BACI|nr:Ger(x)C family spore germination protein [Gracilibacillus orientalis]SFM33512.1 spore germination protein KC [Gracilibacillus orientalis]SFM49289.1 spore germination protein KC [Gracilibacillus orientalis]